MQKLLSLISLLFLAITLSGQTVKPIEKNGLYGLTDGTEMIVDFQYDTIKVAYHGGFYVRKEGKWGKLSSEGTEIIPCKYDKLDAWWPKVNLAVLNGFKGVLDSTGTIILECIYDDIDHMDGTSALVKYQGKWCLYQDGVYSYDDDDLIFHLADTMPLFPGCDRSKGTYKEYKDCATNQMYAFVFSNIHYPVEARKKGIQGMVILQYVVSQDGELQDIEVIRSIGGGCDEEAVRMMKKMPNWIPAVNEGRKVNCQFTMPVKFVLK
ncbi:MAG TPA: TonB family protein [Saprospiraceae bacterium]|nr:TonB family protein [Saprospiraceae bacterium]